MTRRLITAVAVAMVFAAATAYAAVTTIPPSEYPRGCHPNGEALQGGAEGDDLTGTSQRDLLLGGPGADGLLGYEQRDCLFGQGGGGDDIDGRRGDDWIRGGKGVDVLDGGTGDDLLQGGRGDDFSIEGHGGRDLIYGGPGSDHRRRVTEVGGRVRYVAAILGGSGRDRIVDTQGHNDIDCGKGIDKVVTNEKSHVEKCEHVTRR
jgi:Ca2+-binding RTX toxin-like protein